MANRKVGSSIISALVLMLFVSLAIGAIPAAAAQSVAGSISGISGAVTITRGGATIPAVYGAKVDVGDRIITGPASNVTVTLTDGSQIELTDSSNLTIEENKLNPDGTRAATKLSLLTGLVRSLVRSTPGTPPNFEVHTPNAVASARGTQFDVDYHRD